MHALCFDRFGGPEVLSLQELPDPMPGPGCALVRTHAIGLNYADIYRREGHYHLVGQPPYIAGYEGAGEVVALGPGVNDVQVGDRVGFADVAQANATLVCSPVDRLLPLPEWVAFDVAASVLLQGLTAQYLVRDSHPLRPGQTVLVHAAAGGVGSLLTQLITHLGGRVFAVVSSEEKAARARQLGAASAVRSSSDWVAAARAFTGGQGVDVAYDSIGVTLLQSLAATRVGGGVVYFGKAGGEPPPIPPSLLMDGSKRVVGGDLWNVLSSREERRTRASELFEWLRAGVINVDVAAVYPLACGAEAHRALQSRRTVGKVLLRP